MKKATLIAVFAVFAVLASGCQLLTDLEATGSLSPAPDRLTFGAYSPVLAGYATVYDTASYVDIDVAQVGTCPYGTSELGEFGAATGTVTIDSVSFDVGGVQCFRDMEPQLFDLDVAAEGGANVGAWYSADNPDDVEYTLIVIKYPEDDEAAPGETIVGLMEGMLDRYSTGEFLYFGIFTEGVVTLDSIIASIDRAVADGEITFWEGFALKQPVILIENLADLGQTQTAGWLLAGLIGVNDLRNGDFYEDLGDQLREWEPGQN